MFTKEYNKRIRFIFILFIVLLLLVVVKVFFVQTVSYEKLSILSDDLWSRTLPITAERGKILDRNGLVLADNITKCGVIVIPNQIEDKVVVAKVLSEVLNVSYDDVYNDINKNSSIERLHPYGRKLDSTVADKIASYNFKGVYLVKESERIYPYNELLSHVLGYVGIDNQGLSGIELKYDTYLSGADGYIKYYSDAKGNKLDKEEYYYNSVPGMDIVLTIDLKMQQVVERELSNIVSMFSPDNALALAVEPSTGKILAMASRPNFDPNNYSNYSNTTLNRNLPIWMTYEPGSTFNIVISNSYTNKI